jgi:hypothetical protein
MRAALVLEIDDDWLEQRVAEFNSEQEDGSPFQTPRRYVEEVLQEMVVDDSLPLTLWQWKFTASLLVEAPPIERRPR